MKAESEREILEVQSDWYKLFGNLKMNAELEAIRQQGRKAGIEADKSAHLMDMMKSWNHPAGKWIMSLLHLLK